MMKQVIIMAIMLIAGLSYSNVAFSQATSPTGVFTKVVTNDADLVDAEEIPSEEEIANTENSSITKTILDSRIIKKAMTETEQTLALIEKYSAILKISPESIVNIALYKFIEEWYGTRYRMGGTTKSGIDCSAFTQKLYNQVFSTDILRTAILQFRMSDYVTKKENLKEGDLVFFRTNGHSVSHVGIYLRNNYFVHSSSSKGVMISNLDDSYWRKVYIGGGKI